LWFAQAAPILTHFVVLQTSSIEGGVDGSLHGPPPNALAHFGDAFWGLVALAVDANNMVPELNPSGQLL